MPKRKVLSESDKAPKKKLKSESTAVASFVSKLSFDSPEQCLGSLIYPTSLQDFLAKYWEKEPLHIARKDHDYYKGFPTKAKLEGIAKTEHLEYDKDLFLSQDENGAEVLEAEGKATVKSIRKYWKEKLTVLFYKPHRFHEELCRLLQLLEGYFGCCVQCSLEVHTENAHERRPGYIGREAFILQIEGKKKWCLFEPIQKLAYLDSVDLEKDKVGKVTHEFLLEPGDMLYFPRGTVHQTHIVSGEVSSHLSIELYEKHTWGHFLSHIFNKAIREALEKDIAFREGLGINFLSYLGFGKKEFNGEMTGEKNENVDGKEIPKAVVPSVSKVVVENQKMFKEKLDKMLSSLAQYLDPHWGADTLFGDAFIAECLAPKADAEKQSESEKPLTDESIVQLKHPEYVRITLHDPADDEDEDDDDDDDGDVDEGESEGDESMEDDDKKVKENASEKKSKKSLKDGNDANGKEEDSKKSEKEIEDDEEDLDQSFSSKPCIVVYHALNNEIDENEDASDDEANNEKESKEMKFPVHYRDALLVLYRSTKPVAVRDLPLTVEDREKLVAALWCEGLLKEGTHS